MKILHVSPSIGRLRGGASQAVIEMIQVLKFQGLDVELLTTNDNGPELLDVPLSQRVEYCQIPVWFFPRFSPKVAALREFQFSWELTTWLWQHIENYDLLHVHGVFCYSSTIAMSIARIKHIPYINQPHGLLCEWSLQQSKRKKETYLSLIERSNLMHSQGLQFTSTKEAKEVSQLDLDVPDLIIPLGLFVADSIVDARRKLRQKLNIAENEPVILFMSRLHHKKGLEYLIPALGKLRHQKFTFILAGSGSPEYEAEIDTLLTEAGIQDRTHRPGFVTGELKNLFLQGSDIFALTSHSENFGVVVLEAMAAGLTTILTPGVALADVLEKDQVGYVPPLDIDAIARTLNHCLSHMEEVRLIGDRARQLIFENYTWDHIAKNMIQTYGEILSHRSLVSS